MRKVALAIASLVISSLPALANDSPKQTPENAHRFLKIVVEQNGMDVEKYTPDVDAYSSAPFNLGRFRGKDARNPDLGSAEWPWTEGTYWMYPFHAESYEGAGCHSEVKLPLGISDKMLSSMWGELNYNNWGKRPQNQKIHDVDFFPDLREGKLEVDWSKVSGITLDEYNGKARIAVIGGGRFTVPTMDLAKRVQYAMEFLKDACDPTANTGF